MIYYPTRPHRTRRNSLGNPSGRPIVTPTFALMVEPLIRWLTASSKENDIASCDLKLASKWHADDGTLITNSAEDMTSLLDIIQ